MTTETEKLEQEIERLKKLCETMNERIEKTKAILKAVSSIINIDMEMISKKINEEIKKI